MHPIVLRGARTHHLAGVDLDLRPGELLCLTGVSGAGKSSLAFDTLYAEGQRRFVESFSPYARQFLERLERPPIDSLDPVAAGVAVDRRAPIKSSRSTLATMADLEAYLSALFTSAARPLCGPCGLLAEARDADGVAADLIRTRPGARGVVSYAERVADVERFLDVRETLMRDGYRRVLVDGAVRDLEGVKPSEIAGALSVVVDRVTLRDRRRLSAALEEAWRRGAGRASVHLDDAVVSAAQGLACPSCGAAFEPPRSGLFSYESALGACGSCRGFGRVMGIDWQKVIPDERLSLARGAIRPWTGKKAAWERRQLAAFCEKQGIEFRAPWAELSVSARERVLEGEGVMKRTAYPGLRRWFRWLESKSYKMHVRVMLARYRAYDPCPDCGGKRLSARSLGYRVDGLDIGDWHRLELREARRRLEALALDGHGALAQAELVRRLGYLERVGLGYLTLDRQARTLSGGEAQRVSLTAALGTGLTGTLFVLDEPTVGLHPKDVTPLIGAMRDLAARGNAVVVVEHDPAVIAASDRVVELGPGAGPRGGHVVFDGTPAAARKRQELATARATAKVAIRSPVRQPKGMLRVVGAAAHNLAGFDVAIPLGVVVGVCGVSGSGKSTLVEAIVHRAIARHLGDKNVEPPAAFAALEGLAQIREVRLVDQAPLGRTSRGNAATYSGAWTRFRNSFAKLPESEARAFGPSCFSFNVAGGRCEACNGEGAETVEMQFLADVRLVCPACGGRRFREEILAMKLEGLSVADVLALTVEQALARFDDRALGTCLGPLEALGLGYLPLGQPLSTLSGGEAQRLKLARTLKEVKRGSLVILDEPSAGLHATEVGFVIRAIETIVEGGSSAIVVDHDSAVLAAADHLIELGPGAGADGGRVVFTGPPVECLGGDTATGEALRLATSGFRPPAKKPRREKSSSAEIVVRGAREHNLRSVEVTIPHEKLVVVTGPSGSGKSSLAFDVIFAEGQRRFLETLTPYARQFLPTMPRPDVDGVYGLLPSIALEQRTARAGAQSTVATVTEIAHYLRLLYAKVGLAHCPDCELPVTSLSADTLFARLRDRGAMTLLAPAIRARKGTHYDVFSAAERAGIGEAVCDGEMVATERPPRLNRQKEHSIELVAFRGRGQELDRASFDRALAFGQGQLVAMKPRFSPGDAGELLSTARICPGCERSLPSFDPRWFSFNTAQGRCEACEGTGIEGGPAALREAEEDTALEECASCGGARLAPIPRSVRLDGERYHELTARSVSDALRRAERLAFSGDEATIAEAPLAELVRRLRFVDRVGLGYLGLDRRADTLSGGEMQRLRLAAQLGAGLTGALYVLDEPTIGLHPRDTHRLIENLRALVATGSTVIVVEHDADTIRAADHVIDLGPAGGRGGGRIVAQGPPRSVLRDRCSPTANALRNERAIAERRARRPIGGDFLVLRDVTANNLAIDAVRIPLGRMVVVAGVSGSGKSTLVRQVLFPALRHALGRIAPRGRKRAGEPAITFPSSLVARAIAVDQSPIGRTSRSVPATFLGVWDEVRRLYAGTPEARARGYDPSRFSFNNTGGRCDRCDGNGFIAHEMAFLPDVRTTCESCGGLRFEPATLEIRYQGLSAGEALALTVDEAVERFAAIRKIAAPLSVLRDLGVGYVALGQPSPTLSGGEAQRLKLAKELTAGRGHKPTLYVLDEPTTGLHHGDVGHLVEVLDRLVARGDSLVIIEHHPAVIAAADHVIELGPEGGTAGGRLVAEGPPEAIASAKTATGQVLARLVGPAAPQRRAAKISRLA